MATLRRLPQGPPDVRRLLAARYRHLAEIYSGDGVPGWSAPWLAMAARLDAGDEMVVAAWEVCRWVPWLGPYGWVHLDRDGQVTPVRAAHRWRGRERIVDWEPMG